MRQDARRAWARKCADAIAYIVDLTGRERLRITALVDAHMEMATMLQLPDVTLVAADSGQEALTRVALEDCTNRAVFGDHIILGDQPHEIEPGGGYHHQHVISTCASLQEWSELIWYVAPRYVQTSHMLVVQWDSWIINPEAWDPTWIAYDYIGAPWHWHPEGSNVGNGGFSLRSKRLMIYLAQNRKTLPLGMPEDDVICRRYRPHLEEAGFKFADHHTAGRFSMERSKWTLDVPFGFHGMYNWPKVLTREQIAQRLKLATPYVLKSGHCAEMRAIMEATK